MAQKKTVQEPAKPLTRKDYLEAFAAKGYSGPTSYTTADLAKIHAWLEVGAPADAQADVPSGAMYAVHPDTRPAREAKPRPLTRFQQGYQAALAEVAALADLKAVQAWVAENRAEVAK